MKKFQGKYRIDSTRLKDWDYSTPGGYFITICTMNKIPVLGKVVDGKFRPSPLGIIASNEWEKAGKLYESVELDDYVIMPNHLHGIIFLYEVVETPRWGVSADRNQSPVTLSGIINQFKTVCTKRIRARGNTDFTWQSSFYDHIIRDEIDLERIRKYISENPAKWMLDEYYSEEDGAFSKL
jgi:REP element-mobilizing transposase RayT